MIVTPEGEALSTTMDGVVLIVSAAAPSPSPSLVPSNAVVSVKLVTVGDPTALKGPPAAVARFTL